MGGRSGKMNLYFIDFVFIIYPFQVFNVIQVIIGKLAFVIKEGRKEASKPLLKTGISQRQESQHKEPGERHSGQQRSKMSLYISSVEVKNFEKSLTKW